MFDRIAGRALVPVGIVVTGFLIVCFTLLYSAIRTIVLHEAINQANTLAGLILKSTRNAMLHSDRQTNAAILQDISQLKSVEHVRVFSKNGTVTFSSIPAEVNHQVDKKAEGCIVCHAKGTPVTTLGPMEKARTFKNKAGEVVLAITAPIYNEPECSNAACHVHPASQLVLGTLDIGLSQDATRSALISIRGQMVLYSLLTLILTTAGVIALLKMIVLRPMRRLQEYTERCEVNSKVVHPHNLPYELDKIAKSYYFLRNKLDEMERQSADRGASVRQPDS